ncbi:qdpr [Symbiodinium natans]|uniref:Dihydropteridine reductase n=1 Tax=Symbiodinium natans TaxID=878477 RepID=A0A812RZJ5_9DINO|nr:qdpr [Symbiodinium natans]
MAMVESSVYSSIVAAYVSAHMLRSGGLLILPGAAAAWSPTAWSLPYGAAKVAVHHLVRSLAENSLPGSAKTIGLAPQILDTAQNRQAMPDADVSTWATLDEVAEQIESWCGDPEAVQTGHVYLIDKKPGLKATFEARKPL